MGVFAGDCETNLMLLPFLAFLLISLLIGLHSATRIGGKVRNFFVAGNIIPFWVLGLSMTGQAVELGGTLDNATLAMSTDFWAGAILPVGIGLSLIFIGLFFAEPLHRMRLLTLPDFYAKRYDHRVELLVSVLCVSSFMILIAGNLAGAGMILQFTLGIPALLGLFVVGLPVMIYTMAGGLFAVTWNDVLQFGIALIGFSATLLYILSTQDGLVLQTAFSHALHIEVFTSFEAGALSTWASLLALALGDIVALDFMERVFASRTARYAKISCLLAGSMTILVGLGLAFLGTIAGLLMDTPSGENAFFGFLEQYLPDGIRMMMFMGLLAACISTIDGAILACSVVLSKNVVQQNFPKLVPSHKLLTFSRLTAIPVTLGAIVIAIIRPVPGDLLILAFDVVFAGCLVPLALGVYWKKATARAAFWAMIIPSSLRIVIHPIFEHIPGASSYAGLDTLIPPLLSLALMVGISLHEHARKPREACHV